MILDTQFLGALADGNRAAREKAAVLDCEAIPTRIPTAVMWEVYTGAANAPHSRDQLRALYQKLVSSRSTLDLTPDVARRAGELNGAHMRSDTEKELDGADSIIAAHGLLLDEPVVSNDSDFQSVSGLDVVTYPLRPD